MRLSSARARCVLLAAATAAVLALAGCNESKAHPPPPQLKKVLGGLVAPRASASAEESDEPKKRRFPDASVYVDGRAVAGLRFLELPAKLEVRWKDYEDGKRVRRYRLAEYLEALGVDLKTVKELHIYGGRGRISIVGGEELRRVHDTLLFSFTQSERGKPRMHYPSDGVTTNTQVDVITDLVVYVGNTPPKYDNKSHVVSFEEGGEPIEGIPYAAGERLGGTRVYMDGKLEGAIKRKTLPDKLVEPGSPERGMTRYFLRGYLEHARIPLDSLKAVELVSGDEIAATFEAKTFADRSPSMMFTLPKRSRGRIQVEGLPEATSKLDAILLYSRTSPPQRRAAAASGSAPPQASAKNATIAGSANVAR